MSTETGTTRTCDVLVIGGGGSGGLAALEASEDKKLKVVLVSGGPMAQSGLTPTAPGGTHIAGTTEGAEVIFKEMVIGGRYLGDQDLAWFMVSGITDALKKLEALQVPVTRFRERSACVPGVGTLETVRRVLKGRPNVELLEDRLATALLTADGRIAGATVLDLETGAFFTVTAKAVVLATGGMTGELYPHTSNNPFGVTTGAAGMGHVMAYLAGAELSDMEMVQFVPIPANPRALHIRYFPEVWDGPYMNSRGEVVESNVSAWPGASYSYQLVQKLYREIAAGNGPTYIDRRGAPDQLVGNLVRSWNVRRNLIKKVGIDPAQMRIDLVIGSHFNTGGVRIGSRTETTIPGLFAAGEMTSNVHGALRLSGYSFTQMIVFGFEAGRQAAACAAESRAPGKISADAVMREKKRLFRFFEKENKGVSPAALRTRLQQVMEKHFFIVRDRAGMTAGIGEIEAIRRQLSGVTLPPFTRFNLEWVRALELDSLVQAAGLTAAAALSREESRGFHYRSDFPKEDNKEWLKHTVVRLGDAGGPAVGTAPVTITRLRPEV